MMRPAHLLEARLSRLGRWAGAVIVVCALHIAGAELALMHWEEEVDENAQGTLSVEMAPLPSVAPVDTPDLAHGPLTQDATPTPEAAEKRKEEIVKDLPPVDPSPAPEPEVALPRPQPEKEKPEKDEDKAAVVERPSPAEAAQEQIATAPPRVEAQPAPSSAPSAGLSASLARAQARWQNGLMAKLSRFKRYPEAAHGAKGVAVVRFTVDRSGRVVAAEVLKSAGSSILDEEAVALIYRASPFSPPPDELPEELLQNDLPVRLGMKADR
jgi:periplasmic protein TonB